MGVMPMGGWNRVSKAASIILWSAASCVRLILVRTFCYAALAGTETNTTAASSQQFYSYNVRNVNEGRPGKILVNSINPRNSKTGSLVVAILWNWIQSSVIFLSAGVGL